MLKKWHVHQNLYIFLPQGQNHHSNFSIDFIRKSKFLSFMNSNSIKLIYFSPTGTTEKVLAAIAEGIQVDTVKQLDLTPPEAGIRPFAEMHAELAVIGAPVYGGRIPKDAKYRLQRINANNTPAVIVVMYGNREFEDALLELYNIVVEAGFKPVAGGAFIGEHSFENDSTPISKGRPDIKDLQKATEFGRTIRKKLMIFLIVLFQDVIAEVVSEITPDSVNVVGFVLGAVVFGQEGGTEQAIIVAFAAVDTTRPGKGCGVERSQCEFMTLGLCNGFGQARDVHVDKRFS